MILGGERASAHSPRVHLVQGIITEMTDPNSSNPAHPLSEAEPVRAEFKRDKLQNVEPVKAELLEQVVAADRMALPTTRPLLSKNSTLGTAPPNLIASQDNSEPLRLHSLDPAFVTVERIGGWIFSGALLCAGFIALSVIAFNFGVYSWGSACSVFAYLVLGAGLSWLAHALPKKQYQHAGWCLTNSGLEIRHGIWWRTQISVPLARVQHTDVHQGPLLRRFGLARLTVHTAGTENSAVALNGLSFEVAQRLRDALIENRGEIDGV